MKKSELTVFTIKGRKTERSFLAIYEQEDGESRFIPIKLLKSFYCVQGIPPNTSEIWLGGQDYILIYGWDARDLTEFIENLPED